MSIFKMQKNVLEKTSSSLLPNKNADSKSNIYTCDPDKSSILSIVCRICYDGDKDEPIITPCKCKGTVAFVHRSCLETWLAESNTTTCELCNYVYKTERTPKHTARESIWRWFRHQPHIARFNVRGLKSDILSCTILTPLAIIITYVCLFSADYYNQKRFSNIPAAKWTSISLLVMILIMLMAYYIWVYTVIRYHGRVWFYCWQRECTVRYVAPSSQNIGYRHNIIDYNPENEYSEGQREVISEENNNTNSVTTQISNINITTDAVTEPNNNDTIALNEILIGSNANQLSDAVIDVNDTVI